MSPNLVCVAVEVPSSIKHERLKIDDVPTLSSIDYSASRKLGDDWFERGATAVLWMPSVVSPYESNVLFNQHHKDFSRIKVGEPKPARVDPRFWPVAKTDND